MMISPPTQLVNQDHSLATRVYQEMISQSNLDQTYVSEQIWYQEPEKVTTNLTNLLTETHLLLNSNNYPCSKERWFVEIHRSLAKNEKVVTPLAWHQDDDGGWSEPEVVTLIYYLKKDPDLLGGNLLYSLTPDDPDTYLNPNLKVFQPSLNSNKRVNTVDFPIIQVETGKTVMMRGDMWHCPENIQGIGERQLLLVQFPRLK